MDHSESPEQSAAASSKLDTLLASEISTTIDRWPTKDLTEYRHKWVALPTLRGRWPFPLLRASIKKSDVREPLLILPNGNNGVVLDGRHRLQIAKELGIPVLSVRVLTLPLQPDGTLDALTRFRVETYLVREHAARRQLVVADLTEAMLGLAQARPKVERVLQQTAHLKRGPAPGPGAAPGLTHREIARQAHRSERHVKQIDRIARQGTPELQRRVTRGEVSVREADRQLRQASKGPNPLDEFQKWRQEVAEQPVTNPKILEGKRALDWLLAKAAAAVRLAREGKWSRPARLSLQGAIKTAADELADLMNLIPTKDVKQHYPHLF